MGDLLTGCDGQTISSDTIGNMTSDGTWSYDWEHGRQLASMTSGSTTWSFDYNADGMRTNRSNGGTTYSYVYNGSQLSQMTVGSDTLYFAYDASLPMAVTYNGTTYYYATNLQGDVTAILNASGTAVVEYTYDAWGNILTTTGSMASTLGTVNPLRYRGYVYDTETGLYYLQSRYYNPAMGRFICADGYASTGQGLLGNNMFAYCNNNPVNFVDPTGKLTARQIHDEVLREICFGNPDLVMTDTTIYYNRANHEGKWGFCDLYNTQTGEVWELKRYSTAPSCQKSAAQAQLGKYICGCLKHNKEVPLTAGTTHIPSGSFIREDTKGKYFIWYWDTGDGIIMYDYVFTPNNSNSANTALSIAGLAGEIAMLVVMGLCYNSMGSAYASPYEATCMIPFSDAA